MSVPTWLRKGVSKAKEALARERGLAAVYVYGSALKRRDYRDVDVALLPRPGAKRPSDARLARVASLLDKAFGAETDLHWTADLPDPLLHRVIRDGARVITRDPVAAVRFESETLIRFLDFQPAFDRLNARILSRG